MSDAKDRDLLSDLGDLDWDAALDEWEKNTFVPEVARDAETNRVASPLDTSEEEPATEATPRPEPVASEERALKDARGEGTVITPVPDELRDSSSMTAAIRSPLPPRPPPPAPAPPPARTRPGAPRATVARGGLSQLFARDRDARPSLPSIPPPIAPPTPAPPVVREDKSSVTKQVAAPAAEPSDAPEPLETRDALADAPTVSTRDLDGDEESPESATMVADRPRAGSISDADTATRYPDGDEPTASGSPADDEAPTFMRMSRPAPATPSVSRWLDGSKTAAFRQRAAWLDEEARALDDPTERARALLSVSELLALAGDTDEALSIALEARELAPHVALAWRQARQLMPKQEHVLVPALDAEAAESPTPAARAHATLLAADVLRTAGSGDAAVERWESACKLDPADARAPASRAALALAQDDHTSAGAHLAENSELIALDRAVATALRLRGAPRAGADVDEMPVNDGLRRARERLATDDVAGAAQAIAEVAADPSLAKAALWLSAAFGATHIAGRRASARALKTLANEGEALARVPLAARGIELGDPELVTAALASDDAPLDAATRAALLALAGQDPSPLVPELSTGELMPLADALAAVSPGDADVLARARCAAGDDEGLTTLGRLLAARASSDVLDEALAAVPTPLTPTAAGAALETAVRAKRFGEVSEALSSLPATDDAAAAERDVAAALVAERAGDREQARRAWREALARGLAHDGVVRTAAAADPELEVAPALLRVADELPDGPASAMVRLEALARGEHDDETQASVLERVHRAAPALGLGAFLAERIARRRGDLDEVLRWLSERRTYAVDPLETALDAVREALLVADRDPDVASERLEEAHHARPDDAALRELYERLAVDPPSDRAAWREARAQKSEGPTRALLFTEAALEHERGGDAEGALRAARAALEAGDVGLSRLVVERAEIATGQAERQIAELVERAAQTEERSLRREAYERLAELEGAVDPEAALARHRAILEETPDHLPSLRAVEHALIGARRDEELEPVLVRVARALDGLSDGEVAGHAQVAARLRARRASAEGQSASNGDMARLAAKQPAPSLWALRASNAHARVAKDEDALLSTSIALLERTQRPAERAALLLRASEAAARLEHVADARAFLEQAASEDPGDVVTWGFLAEVRERAGETRAAAEACESLARTSAVPEHQLLAWHDAARIWLDEAKDTERGMSALEQAAEIDVAHVDVFARLSSLYADAGLDAELARLLEKRLAVAVDEDERVTLEVELSRSLVGMGELGKAKEALDRALGARPDHTTALASMAELCSREGDWQGAEQAYVRLSRLAASPDEQRQIYDKLGEIYAVHAPNLSRAEMALKEVLKRAPNDPATLERLVDVYKRQGDVPRALDVQQRLASEASDPEVRLRRLVELASIHETAGRDPRRAEQVLESARKEFPTSVVALRAMAEFYARQRQMPAMQILLDRAAGDARRSFAAGRFVTSLFQVLHAAYELRGKKDAARVVKATLAAVEGPEGEGAPPLPGGETRALDPRIDDLLAPEAVGPALRALLFRAGDALDVVAPVDLRALGASPLRPGTPLGTTVGSIATVVGLGAMQIFVSPKLGRVAIPLSSAPATLLVGEALAETEDERARAFVVTRAMKGILTRSSALLRAEPRDVALLVSALFATFNPSFVPQGVDPRRVAELSRRIAPALPRNLDPTIGVIALEAAGALGPNLASLAALGSAWANRVALLALGDPNAALDAIAWSRGEPSAPTASEERAAWIARTQEARELMTFSVSDAYAEARARLGLG